jgi:hypothetical protein
VEVKRLGDFEGELQAADQEIGGECCQGFFSAKPKIKLNMDMVDEAQEDQLFVPIPLKLGRNGSGSEFSFQNRMSSLEQVGNCEDNDQMGRYFGSSQRRGPFMAN